jgi:RNA polymerase sigma-B factor
MARADWRAREKGITTLMTGERSSMALTLAVLRYPWGIVVSARGVVDFATAPVLRAVLFDLTGPDPSGGEPRGVVLDLAAVDLLDGHSVGMLVAASRRAIGSGGSLRMRGAGGRVLRALEISGVDKELHADGPDPALSTVEHSVTDRTIESLLRARARHADPDGLGNVLRGLAIHHGQGLATRLARRYRGRGEPLDDLTQVAMLGLIKAIDGFDPQRTSAFAAYAVPTIVGEIKRYFRDKGWQIRIPRRLQEIRLELSGGALAQRRGRPPTVPELADHLGVAQEEVVEAIEAAQMYRPESLSTPVGGDDGEMLLVDRIGVVDPELDLVDYRESLRPLLAALPARQQAILAMRFYGNMTQSQIAATVGLSQMHVSRLLSDALGRLRHGLTVD